MTLTTTPHLACACSCGRTRFALHAVPFARFYCHCLVCQRLYAQPVVDVAVVPANAVEAPPAQRMRVARYRPPPALNRATCIDCGKPLFGVLPLLPFGAGVGRTFAFVPTANIAERAPLPAPAMHIFYDRRVQDSADALPTHAGYLRSQLAVCALILRGLSAARRDRPSR